MERVRERVRVRETDRQTEQASKERQQGLGILRERESERFAEH
jgi:hypothetical protein